MYNSKPVKLNLISKMQKDKNLMKNCRQNSNEDYNI